MNKLKKALALALCLLLPAGAVPAASAEAAEEPVPEVTGTIIEIEKYGNAVLDISIEDFEAEGYTLGDVVTVTAENYNDDVPYLNGYYVEKGEGLLRAYPNEEHIAVCINYGNFAEETDAEIGDTVVITLKEDDGALALQEVNNLVYTNDRSDYPLDRVFANFRPVVMGSIPEGRLFRSASPADNRFGRAAYANELAELTRVNAVMNLADTDADLQSCFAAEDFSSDYYRRLYEDGRVIPLALPISFETEDFAQGIVRGLTFLAEQEPPYLVHCTEGKDRCGFASMVLEALMGAAPDEIIADYMVSYENYYGLEPGTEKYDMVISKNIMLMLPIIAGTDDLESVDLAAATEAYLLKHGMDPDSLAALKDKLSRA